MVQASMIEFAEYAEPSVAPFFVAGRVRRTVMQTRRVNERILLSDTTEPGARQGIGTAAGSNLNIAHIDIECPFYRIASPPGLSELMVLLPLRRIFLVANCPDAGHVSSRLVSPRLTLLP